MLSIGGIMILNSPSGCPDCGPIESTSNFGLNYFEKDSSILESYVAKVGAPMASDWIPGAIHNVLRARRLYGARSSYQGEYGDCGGESSISLGVSSTIGKVDSLAGTAVAATGVIGAVSAGGSTAFAATALGAATGALGIATAGLGLALLPFILISKHHAVAVAREQNTLCDVVIAYDQFADQIEPLIQSGQMSLANAIDILDKVNTELQNSLDVIAQGSGAQCNAGCGYKYILRALVLYNKDVLYPSYVPQALLDFSLGTAVDSVLAPIASPVKAINAAINKLDTSKAPVIPGVKNSSLAKGGLAMLVLFCIAKAIS